MNHVIRYYILALAIMYAMLSTRAAGQGLAEITRPGANIQRTMKLLEESTPLKRNTVRILFYGQSITAQDWWRVVASDFVKRYPFANLIIENRAIGGFTAPLLIKTAEYDLYPYYPDLVIFHVYADDSAGTMHYEEIIRHIRSRTTAEILLTTHHDAGTKSHYAQSAQIREIAVKYKCGLVDIEHLWQEFMKREGLEPKDLLEDVIHLNERGNDLYACFLKRFLIYNPDSAKEVAQKNVNYILIGDTNVVKRLVDGSIEIRFTGNRIDAIPVNNIVDVNPMADVLIDGRKPSDYTGACQFSRPSPVPYGWMPAFVSVSHLQPLMAESWTLRVLKSSPDGKSIRFSVTGSVTGKDGKGTNTSKFTSKSGRIVIEGGDNWMVGLWLDYHGKRNNKEQQMPAGYKVKWSVDPHFNDILAFSKRNYNGIDNAVTLIQGISNDPHVLRLVPWPGIDLNIEGFRVYHPPLSETTVR